MSENHISQIMCINGIKIFYRIACNSKIKNEMDLGEGKPVILPSYFKNNVMYLG